MAQHFLGRHGRAFGRLAVVIALVAASVAGVPLSAAASSAIAAPAKQKSVPGKSMGHLAAAPLALSSKSALTPAAVHLHAGTFTVDVPSSAVANPVTTTAVKGGPAATVAGAWHPVGTSGISLAPAKPAGIQKKTTAVPTAPPVPLSAGVTARVLSAAQSRAAGAHGIAIQLTWPNSNTKTTPIAVQIPQTLLASLYGADFSSRIRWVQMSQPSPSDFSSSPQLRESLAAVSPTAVASGIDPQTKTLVVTPNVSARPTILTAMSSPVSATGTGSFAATPLNAASSWDVSAQTGDFAWSLPMRTPPAAAGPAPQLSLNYDSQTIDGETGATINQPSSIGDGWTLGGAGYIQRQYVSCSQDTGASGPVTTSGDLCWLTDNATLNLGGHSGTLVKDATTGAWKLQTDDGTRIVHLNSLSTGGGCTNGDNDNECWKVTTTDGTQYFFGLNQLPGYAAGAATTKSTWTVPVFGNDVGEQCHLSTFATSSCNQAWRWNLDYVVDIHSNAEAIYYTPETNKYALNGATATTYTRGGAIASVQYGITGSSAYATNAASDQVMFGYAANGRCNATTGCTSEPIASPATAPTTPSLYPDVPWDEYCTGSTCPGNISPTFWSDAELSTVTTKALVSESYATVDMWTLGHSFPAPGDGTAAALWLTQVAHQGTSSSATEPATVFSGTPMQNRVWAVDGLAPLDKYRITSLTTSLGAVTSVNYSAQQCTPAGAPAIEASPQTNTNRCFPQWWSPSVVPPQAPQEDLFHKYVVTSVLSNPETGGGNDATQETYYDYSAGLPAWRYDNSPFTLANQRTWNVYAGYDKVRVTTGSPSSPSTQQTSLYTFYQGIDGDRLNSSGGTKSHFVDGSTTLPDSLWFAGQTRETATTNGIAGALLSDTVNTPWASSPTAIPSGSAPSAYMTAVADVQTIAPLAAGGTRMTETKSTFDPTYGLPLTVETSTPDAGAKCVTTTYTTPNTTAWIIGLPKEIDAVGTLCAGVGSAIFPASAISDTRITYDSGTVGSMPTKGDPTKTEEVDSYSGSGGSIPHWITSGQSTYDSLGRPLQVTDVLGHTAATAYTPAAAGPLTSTVSTNTAPFHWTTTTTIDPRWGVELTLTDANSNVTTAQYDGLGRRTGVWLPGRAVGSFPTSPSLGYAYSLSTTAANAVETSTLAPSTTLNSFDLYDGLGRKVQSQSAAEGGGSDITDTAYNSAGSVSFIDNPYWTSSVAPSTALFVPFSMSAIPSQTATNYDGAGRTIATILNTGGTERSHTTYAYPGTDQVDVTPPLGGTPTSTVSNSLGETTALIQYLATTPLSTATEETTHYGYNIQGSMTSMTDPAGNAWSWGFDVLGHQTTATDPDTGTSTSTYDDAGELLTSTDARTKVLAYTYDNLGRKTNEYQNSTGPSGSLLDSWAYDTLKLGQPTASTSYVGSTAGTPGTAYSDTITGYDGGYRPTGDTVFIPAAAPAFGGTTGMSYTNHYTYNVDGTIASVIYPAEGGLAAETLRTSYDSLGMPVSVGGTSAYAHTIYTALGQVSEQDRSGATNVETLYGYDSGTRLVNQIDDTSQAGTITQVLQNSVYTHDLAGNVTKIAATSDTLVADTQCFNYDYLQNLTQAWTPADNNCGSAPSSANIGGLAPYWTSYLVDPQTGNRLSSVENPTTTGGSSTTDTYTYPTATTVNPHAVQSVSHVTGGSPTSSTYGYDAAGNTTTRPGQTLTYDAEGKVSTLSAGSATQSNVYDASGNLLLQQDSTTGSTLFLGATELHLATGSSTASAVRTYTANGEPVAERSTVAGVSGSTVAWLAADAQGTVDLQVAVASGVITQRLQDPFGQARGSSSTTWADGHGFLNATTSSLSSLTQLGARMYDASVGRFLSVDPALAPLDPQQNNGYSYSHNSPLDLADPTGLMPVCDSSVCHNSIRPSSPAGQVAAPPASGNAANVQLSPHVFGDPKDPRTAWMIKAYHAEYGNAHNTETVEMNYWFLLCAYSGPGCPPGFIDTLKRTQQAALTDGTAVVPGAMNAGVIYYTTDGKAFEWEPGTKFMFPGGGTNGASKSFTMKGTGWRLDVENPAGGNGAIHIQPANGTLPKYYYNPITNSFADKSGNPVVNDDLDKLQSSKAFQRELGKALQRFPELSMTNPFPEEPKPWEPGGSGWGGAPGE